MKSLKLLLIVGTFFIIGIAQAQIGVSINVGTAPAWGIRGNVSRYYYLPDVESYYDVESSMFIYNDGGVWVHRAYLPERYRGYDLYHGNRIMMTDYHGNSPYSHYEEHRMRYGRRPNQFNNESHRDNSNFRQGNNNHRNAPEFHQNQNRPSKNSQHQNNKGNRR